MKKFYLTTSILYASYIPHIGNIYEIILSDAIIRYKKAQGFDTFFQTGTDEHGIKIANVAANNSSSPQEYVDHISDEIKGILSRLNIQYTKFMRTTDKDHENSVQLIFEKLLAQDDIYLGKYKGWYSVKEESFVSENEVKDGYSTDGEKLEIIEEEAYFFRLSKYQDRLIQFFNEHPDFIIPQERKNEMVKSFLEKDLPDLCVSRTTFDWGIKVKSNPKHVIYVWIDALANYITSIGYLPGKKISKYWPADLHVIGKDILRFHSIYWPILLMALDLPLPIAILAHPWILFNKEKMSKTTHNVIYVDDLLKFFPQDVIRYYCIHEIGEVSDGNLTLKYIIEKNNSDLCNTLGNLINRVLGMATKYIGGSLTFTPETYKGFTLKKPCQETYKSVIELMDKYKAMDALEKVIELTRTANKYIQDFMPWEIVAKIKENPNDTVSINKIHQFIYELIETIRYVGVLIAPFLPDTSEKINSIFNFSNYTFTSLKKWGNVESINLPDKAPLLFPRLDEVAYLNEIEGYFNDKK